MTISKWDSRWLGLAEHVASWSKDPSTQVGAVVARDKRLISVGFNGFPAGVDDSPERYADRDLKYKMIVHGEINAMNFAEQRILGCTLYTWPFMPCPRCAGPIIQRGITRIVSLYSDNPRWVADFEISKVMFKEANIQLILV